MVFLLLISGVNLIASNKYEIAGTTGLAIWAVTLAALLAGGALLVYSTSALSQ